MSRLGKMPGWQRTFVIYGMLACSVTGILYLLGHQFHIQRSTLGSHSILAAHGIAAMLAILALGSVLPFHIKAGYKSKRQWWSGFSKLGILAVLAISGALLYYGPVGIRDAVIDTHWVAGLFFCPLFIWHGMMRRHKKA